MADEIKRVPFVEGVPGPRGFILFENQAGERFWQEPNGSMVSGVQVSVLTETQRLRVKNIAFVFREHQKEEGGLQQIIREFEMDEHPEQEIRIWETAAKLYLEEIARRPGAAPRQRQLLYRAILACMTVGSSVDDMLSHNPELKGLSKLARIGEGYTALRLMDKAKDEPPAS